MKKILLAVVLIFVMVALVACGSDDADDNGNGNGGNEIAADPTPPTIVIQQHDLQTTPTPQVVEPHELTRADFLADLDYFVDTLEADFLHFGVVYRRFGVDFRQNAAELRDIIADENFEIDIEIFVQLMLDNFFMHPDITYSVAGWHFNGLSQRSDGFDGTSGFVEVSVLEEGRIGYIRINCFDLSGLGARGNASRITENFLNETADFEHMIIDIRGVDGRSQSAPWSWLLLSPNIPEEIITQTYYFFVRGMFRVSNAAPSMVQHAVAIADMRTFDALDTAIGLDFGFHNIRMAGPQEDAVPFAGQIWLLIDGGVGGVVASFANDAKDWGVATLVGTPVGGDMPLVHIVHQDYMMMSMMLGEAATISTLPNAQISFGFHPILHTDHLGRAFDEYVTQPHVLVPNDVDALEYLLEMLGN